VRVYETMIIFDPDLDDDAVQALVGRFQEVLTSHGGRTRDVDHWGRRQLAYEIRHKREGYYVVMAADAEPAAIAELDRVLSLADEVFRHKILRLPDHVAQPLGTS
jgi:small subunit ribosomal protein S6